MSEVDWNDAPSDAEACIDGAFIKWHSGDEFEFIDWSWEVVKGNWTIDNYSDAFKETRIEIRPDNLREGEKRMEQIAQNGNEGELYYETDNVNHPEHYQSDSGVECIDAIEAGKVLEEPSQEWVDGLPPVGCECEVKRGGAWVGAEVLRKHPATECVAVMFFDSKHLKWVDNQCIRPLKTQDQKDREAFVEKANLKVTRGYMVDQATGSNLMDIFGDMFDAGFKAPEGE